MDYKPATRKVPPTYSLTPLSNLIQAPLQGSLYAVTGGTLNICTGISTPDISKPQPFKSPQKQHPVTTI